MMKRITKKTLAVTIMVIVILIIIGLLMIKEAREQENVTVPTSTVVDIQSTKINHVNIVSEDDIYNYETAPTETPQITLITPNPPIAYQKENKAIALITIKTDVKTRTYDVMPNVDETTLKKNIGYLPSSIWFGEEGLCVLMGHRDTDFSILQYVEIGDEILVNDNDKQYLYNVVNIEIIDSDSDLRFDVLNGKYLVLVTCYPFMYSGHAPQKYIVYALY